MAQVSTMQKWVDALLFTGIVSTIVLSIVLTKRKKNKLGGDIISAEVGKEGKKKIVELTGVGGEDDGKQVRGYQLPDNIEDIKFPISITISPNRTLYEHRVGEKMQLSHSQGTSAVWKGKVGDVVGDYHIWYENLKKSAVETIA